MRITVKRSGDTSGSRPWITPRMIPGPQTIATTRTGSQFLAAISMWRLAGLIFSPGETEKVFVVVINRDSRVEMPFESFTVKLSGPTGGAALGATSSATVQIDDASAGCLRNQRHR